MHAWRWLLRCFGASINLVCHSQCGSYLGTVELKMASKACLDRVLIAIVAPVALGERVVVSQGAYLCTGSHNYNLFRFPLF